MLGTHWSSVVDRSSSRAIVGSATLTPNRSIVRTMLAADIAPTTHQRDRLPSGTGGAYACAVVATVTVSPIDDLRELLARDPCPPRNPNLFTSNTLFGEPGIYPGGTPMEPAAGSPMSDDRVRDE